MAEDYNEEGQLTAHGLVWWADSEGRDYLFTGHGVDVDEMDPAIRDDVRELEQLYKAADAAFRAFVTKHGVEY